MTLDPLDVSAGTPVGKTWKSCETWLELSLPYRWSVSTYWMYWSFNKSTDSLRSALNHGESPLLGWMRLSQISLHFCCSEIPRSAPPRASWKVVPAACFAPQWPEGEARSAVPNDNKNWTNDDGDLFQRPC